MILLNKKIEGELKMKISRSILIFFFISSILEAFSYALYRTDGNVYKSVLFTLYQTNQLTSQNISKGFIVYERLSI